MVDIAHIPWDMFDKINQTRSAKRFPITFYQCDSSAGSKVFRTAVSANWKDDFKFQPITAKKYLFLLRIRPILINPFHTKVRLWLFLILHLYLTFTKRQSQFQRPFSRFNNEHFNSAVCWLDWLSRELLMIYKHLFIEWNKQMGLLVNHALDDN